MAITYYTQAIIRCLSTDTKPTTGILVGAYLIETDTLQKYKWNGSDWAAEDGEGLGDMTKAVYDPDEDGVIATAQLDPTVGTAISQSHDGDAQDIVISGKATLAEVKADDTIADALTKRHTANVDTDLDATFEATFEKVANKNAANGYCPLGADGLVPSANLPAASSGEAFPVGAVFLAVVDTNPGTLLGYGTWSQIANGKFLVGQSGLDADFDTAEETGGAKTHTLTESEMPAHVHAENAPSSASSGALKFGIDTNASGTQDSGLSTGSTGSGTAFSIVPPYFVVYVWKRTA